MLIRDTVPDDVAAIRSIYAPYVLETVISFEESVPDATELARRMDKAHLHVVAELEGTIAGYAYASAHRSRPAYRHACDVSVYVSRDMHGKGIGTALYDVVLPRLAALGFHRAYGGIALPNPASVALHERQGFRHIGTYSEVGRKFGRWHDVGWWEKAL